MAKKRYYWLKLMENFFQQPKIKKLRRIAGGDTYTVIYLKLQLLSLKTEGRLYFDGIEDNFADEIALTIDEESDNVRFTLLYLRQHGLIEEVTENEYAMPEAMACIGSESASAERVRRLRERQKTELTQALPAAPELLLPATDALHCNADVTTCNTEIEIERDIDIEKERETDAQSAAGNIPASRPRSKRFKAPSVDDVRAYCIERGNKVDPQRFVDYYTANGWKVGRNPMKDWKATVRTWERTENDAPRRPAQDERKRIKGAEEHAKGGHESGIGW